MGSPATIDFKRLLEPIPGNSPTGIDLRTKDADSHESIYWQLRSARNESGEVERKFLNDPSNPEFELSRCRWTEIIPMAVDVLAQQSKDMEITAWLCDSLLRVNGFAGLRDGLRLSRELAEKYWDTLYPSLDPSSEGVAARLNQFGSLFRARQHPAFRVRLTEGSERFTELDYEQAQSLEKVADVKEKQARIAKGEVTLQKFTESVRETPTPALKALAEDIEECLIEGEKLSAALKPRCGKDERGEDLAPSAREFTEVLKKVQSVVKLVAGDRIAPKPVAADAAEAGGKSEAGNGVAAAEPRELTRDIALARLRDLADFFRRVEPHSPISHHLEEAVRWGQLPLPELLMELIPDENARKNLFTRIGIVMPVKK